MALTRKRSVFAWTSERQEAFETLKSCQLQAPILGFRTEADRFVSDTEASLFAVGGVLSQIQGNREVVIAYASRSLRQSQHQYCATHREMLAAVTMCTHFRSYLRVCAVHSAHRSPVPQVASEVLQQRRYAGSLVHTSRPVLRYLLI